MALLVFLSPYFVSLYNARSFGFDDSFSGGVFVQLLDFGQGLIQQLNRIDGYIRIRI